MPQPREAVQPCEWPQSQPVLFPSLVPPPPLEGGRTETPQQGWLFVLHLRALLAFQDGVDWGSPALDSLLCVTPCWLGARLPWVSVPMAPEMGNSQASLSVLGWVCFVDGPRRLSCRSGGAPAVPPPGDNPLRLPRGSGCDSCFQMRTLLLLHVQQERQTGPSGSCPVWGPLQGVQGRLRAQTHWTESRRGGRTHQGSPENQIHINLF